MRTICCSIHETLHFQMVADILGRQSAGVQLASHSAGEWWARQDLNLGPTDYESAALTAELRALRNEQIIHDLL